MGWRRRRGRGVRRRDGSWGWRAVWRCVHHPADAAVLGDEAIDGLAVAERAAEAVGVSRGRLLTEAGAFLTWLEEAEEESDKEDIRTTRRTTSSHRKARYRQGNKGATAGSSGSHPTARESVRQRGGSPRRRPRGICLQNSPPALTRPWCQTKKDPTAVTRSAAVSGCPTIVRAYTP